MIFFSGIFATSIALIQKSKLLLIKLGLYLNFYFSELINKNKYLEHMPRVWHLLEKSCQSAFLAPLEAWLNEFIPFEKRYKLPTKSLR